MDLFQQSSVSIFNVLSRLVIAVLPRNKLLSISWLQSPSAVILGPPKIKSLTGSIVFPSYFPWSDGTWILWSSFLACWVYANFFTLLFHFHQEAVWFLFAFCHKCGVICCLRLSTFLQAILIPACASSSPAFLIMYSAYKLNKHGDNIQPWHTPLPVWNQSVPCPVLTVASRPAYRFLRRQVRWSGIPISLRSFHSLLSFTQSKALA